MNYTNKQVDAILNRVWEDRLKGGGWKDKETFINTMKPVKKLTIPRVSQQCELLLSAICQFTKRNTQKEIQEVEKWIETDFRK
jgi:hypothetical protein